VRSRCVAPLLLVASLAACESPASRPRDAAAELPPRREATVAGEGHAGSRVDFVVQGCAKRTADKCLGVVPLTLVFSAVADATPPGASWDFGDGSPAGGGPVVSHSYEQPGSFTVMLSVSVASGTVSERKDGFVAVSAVGAGGPCSSDAACASGKCACAGGQCPFPLSQGLCLQECAKLACHSPAMVCVDLSVAGAPQPAEPWRTQLCLPGCAADDDCARRGFGCRQAPSSGGWVKACLPPFPRDVSEPCRRADGTPDGASCVGGLCLAIGAGGYCSAACGAAGCPDGTRCARFSGEDASSFVCLRRCAPAGVQDACGASDPQLGCELPSPVGYYGFQIAGPPEPPGTRFCAVKRCASDPSCGATGRCDLAKGGFCVPR
jgi:PKD repeat protein